MKYVSFSCARERSAAGRLIAVSALVALAVVGTGFRPQLSAEEPAAAHAEARAGTNWAGNYKYLAERIHEPATVEELQEIVRKAEKVKARGSRHSFTSIADTSGDLISMSRFNRLIKIDPERRQVVVEGGMRYGELAEKLQEQGFALPNLASLPHISIAGAVSTGTHGSGDMNGSLATSVAALEFVAANGELVKLSREANPDEFPGAVVSLGALGVITKLTLDVEPTFDVAQYVYLDMPFAALERNFSDIMSRGYSSSLFLDWSDTVSEVWIKRRVRPGEGSKPAGDWFGANPATGDVHPVITLDPQPCTPQMGVAGPWHERLPHFKLDFTPSVGNELHSEYFVDRKYAWEALKAVQGLRDKIIPVLYISEIRTIAEDDLWLSMCYGRPSVALHFTWKPDTKGVLEVLPLIEKELEPYAVRAHWGKLSTLTARQLEERYPRMDHFRTLLEKYDPQGKFRNDYLDARIFVQN